MDMSAKQNTQRLDQMLENHESGLRCLQFARKHSPGFIPVLRALFRDCPIVPGTANEVSRWIRHVHFYNYNRAYNPTLRITIAEVHDLPIDIQGIVHGYHQRGPFFKTHYSRPNEIQTRSVRRPGNPKKCFMTTTLE